MKKRKVSPSVALTDMQIVARRANAAKASEGRRRAAAARRDGKVDARPPSTPARPRAKVSASVEAYEVSRARREAANALVAELEAKKMQGELVPLAEVRAEVVQRYTLARTKLLAVPARVRQRAPHLAGADVRLVEDLIREALEEIADGGDAPARAYAACSEALLVAVADWPDDTRRGAMKHLAGRMLDGLPGR